MKNAFFIGATLVGAMALVVCFALIGAKRQEVVSPAPPIASAASDGTESRLQEIENRLTALQRAPRQLIQPVPATSASSYAARPRVSSEESAADHRADHEAKIANHNQEPVDRAWSSKTEAAFATDLSGLATKMKAPFTVDKVDCRSTSCTADISFPNFGGAMKNWRDILSAHYTTNCQKEMFLGNPSPGAGTYQTTVFYNCAQSRSN